MSLPLSGQLGSAELGAAQLGQLASAAVQGAFMLPPAGGGAVVEEPKNKKKRKKRTRDKLKSSSVPSRVAGPVVLPTPRPGVPTPIISESLAAATAETLKAVAETERRLRETIAEEDELIELGVL